MSTIIILLVIGIMAGFLSGLIGIGGGIVIVPFLFYLLHMDQKTAQGTTLCMFLLPIGALMNFASSSLFERFGWGPIALVMALLSLIVALG